MNKQRKLLLSSVAALLLTLTGCQSTNTLTITANDQTVVVPKSPKKVVVMNYGALDTLDALGKGSIVKASPLTSMPTYLQQYQNAHLTDTGSMKEPNVDAIKQIKPDLIIIDGRQAKRTAELSKIAPVINLSVDANNYLLSTKNHIKVLANITGTDKVATDLLQLLDTKITNAQAVTQTMHQKAIVAIHNDGKMILINNSSSAALIHDVLKVKRAVPLTVAANPDPTVRPKPVFIDSQFINKVKPDIIYVVDRSKAIGQQAMATNYFDHKLLKKNKTHIVYLTADLWYLSGGGVESLDRQIDEVINSLK